MVLVRAMPGEESETVLNDRLLAAALGVTAEIIEYRTEEEVWARCAPERAKLPEMKARYQEGLHPRESLLIKARFRGGDTVEWMWVDVLSWKETAIEGILQNQPEALTELKPGSRVSVAEADVCTYEFRGAE